MLACPRCVAAIREGDTCATCQGLGEEIDASPEIEASFDAVAGALKDWRNRQAGVQRMERFRVVANQTLVHLAGSRPTTRDDLLKVQGIGPAKARDYGYVLTRYFRELTSGAPTEGPLLVSSPIPEDLSEDQIEMLFALRTLEGSLPEMAKARGVSEEELVARIETLVRRGCADVVHLVCSPLDIHLVARYVREHPEARAEELARALPATTAIARRLVPVAVEREGAPAEGSSDENAKE